MDLNDLRWVGLVAIGGAVGSVARYGISGLLTRGGFPWGTFAVNFAGTFLLCLLFFAFLQGGHIPTDVRTLLFIGVFGGFTTFATFGLETVTLVAEGQAGLAAVNVALNAGGCLGGAFLGRAAGLLLGGV
jgi:fluoride exporter